MWHAIDVTLCITKKGVLKCFLFVYVLCICSCSCTRVRRALSGRAAGDVMIYNHGLPLATSRFASLLRLWPHYKLCEKLGVGVRVCVGGGGGV